MFTFGCLCLMLGMGCAFAAAEVYDMQDEHVRALRLRIMRYRHG